MKRFSFIDQARQSLKRRMGRLADTGDDRSPLQRTTEETERSYDRFFREEPYALHVPHQCPESQPSAAADSIIIYRHCPLIRSAREFFIRSVARTAEKALFQ